MTWRKVDIERSAFQSRWETLKVLVWQRRSPKSAGPFLEGEFLQNFIMSVCDVPCSSQNQLFENVSLSRNSIADRIFEMATGAKTQQIEKGEDFVAYSLMRSFWR